MKYGKRTKVTLEGNPKKKKYSSPKLVYYGAVSELTTGGSSGKTELNPKGECTSNSKNKIRC